MKVASLILLLVAVCGPALAGATTWSVEQDGSGDWYTIQAAVFAAGNGDTIQIGPGHYSAMHEAPYSLVVAYWDTPNELYFIGAGVDSTIIGPEVYTDMVTDQYGFNYVGSSPQHLQDLTFVNVDFGARLMGSAAWVSNCRTSECQYGITIYHATEGKVANSEFLMCGPESPFAGVLLMGAQNIVVDGCGFRNMDVYLHGAEADTIRNCVFRGEWRGADGVFYMSSGVFEYNEVSGGGVWTEGTGRVDVRDNEFHYDPIDGYNIMVSGKSPTLEIHRNVFHGGHYATIYLMSFASIAGSMNTIVNEGGQYAVRLEDYTDAYPSTVDLRNNYWGTSDVDSIAAMIYDGNDDYDIKQTVQFEPFSSVPLPAEQESLGGFKALFR